MVSSIIGLKLDINKYGMIYKFEYQVLDSYGFTSQSGRPGLDNIDSPVNWGGLRLDFLDLLGNWCSLDYIT